MLGTIAGVGMIRDHRCASMRYRILVQRFNKVQDSVEGEDTSVQVESELEPRKKNKKES
jgi:hypothetical protein